MDKHICAGTCLCVHISYHRLVNLCAYAHACVFPVVNRIVPPLISFCGAFKNSLRGKIPIYRRDIIMAGWFIALLNCTLPVYKFPPHSFHFLALGIVDPQMETENEYAFEKKQGCKRFFGPGKDETQIRVLTTGKTMVLWYTFKCQICQRFLKPNHGAEPTASTERTSLCGLGQREPQSDQKDFPYFEHAKLTPPLPSPPQGSRNWTMVILNFPPVERIKNINMVVLVCIWGFSYCFAYAKCAIKKC